MAADCDSNPIEGIREVFIDRTMGPRILAGQQPVRRAVFLKPHGAAYGTFSVSPDLAKEHRIGVFAGSAYPCWLRFSSDTQPLAPDRCSTVGLGMKLFDVPGEKLLESAATTQDFILQFVPRFFVPNAVDMCKAMQNFGAYLRDHPITQVILDEMAKPIGGVFRTPYWSVVPYRFGATFVKYKVVAVGESDAPAGASIGYLHDDMKARLLAGPVTLQFFLQFFVDEATTPVDDATVTWDEHAAPPQLAATIELPRQDIDAPGQAMYAENLAMNPWHALPVHAPAGSINEARRVVYRASADLRRYYNGVAESEPAAMRPATAPTNVIPPPQCVTEENR